MDDLDARLHALHAAYAAAVWDKDVDAFMRLYDADVRVFDTWGVWSYDGADAWRRAIEAWFGSLGTERVEVRFDAVRCAGSGGYALLSAFVGYAGLSAEGQRLRAMNNRLSWVLAVRDGTLTIVHEHTSAPVGFEDAKAILLRPAGPP